MIGGAIIMFIYLVFLFRSIRIFKKCPFAFGAFLALGLSFTLMIQAIANMAVNVNLFPVTGVTLPLISMGGSSFLFTCLAIGIILSVARNAERIEGEANQKMKMQGSRKEEIEDEKIKSPHSYKKLVLGKKIIIAGGGTGGHIFPALSIANALRKKEPDMDILFVGANGKMEMEKIPEAGYPIEGIDIAGYNRSSLIKNITLPYKLIKSFLQVKGIFKAFQPEAAIGVGGYSTFPVLRYAQARGIPTFIHESIPPPGNRTGCSEKKQPAYLRQATGWKSFFL